MPSFFDIKSRTLHLVVSDAGASKLPQEVVMDAIKVQEPDLMQLTPVTLRRSHCDTPEKYRQFFSTDDKQIHTGPYSPSVIGHPDIPESDKKTDLVEIEKTIVYS